MKRRAMAVQTDLHYLSITEAARLLRQKSISPVELVQSVLHRIEEVDGRVKAFATVLAKEARAAAARAEKDIRQGKYLGPLHGIPIAIKDLYDTAGVVTASGSKIRSNYVPKSDATVVRKLREAGAIVIGKVTTHEFAFGFDAPPTRNPWNLNCTPSGSSGGSGAALAAGLCFGATGSDTGGSIRAPGAVNGIAGIKPTYGRVSKHGIAVLSWSLDHAGPMARTTADVALLLQAMAGYDPKDPTTRDIKVPNYPASLKGDIKGVKIGVPQNYFFDDVQPSVRRAVTDAVATLKKLGGKMVEVKLEHFDDILPTFFSIVMPEAATYHLKNFRERGHEYGADVRELLETGQLTLATTYIAAQRNRSVIKASLAAALEKADVLVTPTLPVTAAKVGQEVYEWKDRKEPVFAACARFLCPFNLAGLPATSVSCGFSEDHMPIGLQVAGKPFDEATVLRVADALEKATDWHQQHPSL
jgi:aspartyl-tRNA(Asn)/glutamyl-tRNA(Gln) amidotransferase subunit A